ncbi:MAG: hypothetical protein HND47_13140 [Chloroflexi bacterium]|nr:hypothetical protein [Chloroflexota bacterium]
MDVSLKSKPSYALIIMRSLLLGLIYALVNALAAIILGSLSRLSPSIDNLLVGFFTGTIVCLSISPFVINSHQSRQFTIFAVWAVLAFVRVLGLGIEGALFKPSAAINAIAGATVGILTSLVIAWAAVQLLLPIGQESSSNLKRNWWEWAWRVLIVGGVYFACYFIFGATNFLLYTRSFYENNPQYGLARPEAGIIFLAQLLRGPLFGLGSLFILQTVALLPRRKIAVWLGIVLFVVGGLAPYVEITFRTMPIGFNLATITELLFQNFLTGILAAYILIPKQSK